MTARSWIRDLFARPPRTIREEPHACRGTPMRLRPEQLEDRDCPAGVFDNDYSQDVFNFFTPARRALVDFAEVQLSQFLNDNLTEITTPAPNNGNDFVFFSFRNTANGQGFATPINTTIPANRIRVYLWGAPASSLGSNTLATCGPALVNFGSATSKAFQDMVRGRGQTGALATPATDTSVAVVRMDVNMNQTFFESTDPPPVGAPNDFVTMIEHELMHPLGFLGGVGGNPATLNLLNGQGQ